MIKRIIYLSASVFLINSQILWAAFVPSYLPSELSANSPFSTNYKNIQHHIDADSESYSAKTTFRDEKGNVSVVKRNGNFSGDFMPDRRGITTLLQQEEARRVFTDLMLAFINQQKS